MIIDNNTHPNRQLYYLGAKTIKAIKENDDEIELLHLFEKIKEKEDLSLMLFILTLDWLYLLGAIRKENGIIKLCS